MSGSLCFRVGLIVGAVGLLGVGSAAAQVPTYRVEPIEVYNVTTSLWAASEAGHVCGSQVKLGQLKPFVGRVGEGLSELPSRPGTSLAWPSM